MIAYIDLPLRGTHKLDGHDVLVIGLAAMPKRMGEVEQSYLMAIFVDEGGDMGQTPLEEINVNWRYDNNRHKWTDVDTGEELETDGEG